MSFSLTFYQDINLTCIVMGAVFGVFWGITKKLKILWAVLFIAFMIAAMITGIKANHLAANESTMANIKLDSVYTRLDTVSKQLDKCRTIVNNYNTNNTNIYNNSDGTPIIHFDSTKDAYYFTHIIDTTLKNHKKRLNGYWFGVNINYSDEGTMATYAKELKFYLRDKYNNIPYISNNRIEILTGEAQWGKITVFKGVLMSCSSTAESVQISFSLPEPYKEIMP